MTDSIPVPQPPLTPEQIAVGKDVEIRRLEARVRELEQDKQAMYDEAESVAGQALERLTALTQAHQQVTEERDRLKNLAANRADYHEVVADRDKWVDVAAEAQQAHQQTVWPNIVAPAQYDNPAEGWEDARLPDFQLIWRLAREVGYAVGIHGSLKRDVDLIAAPWTDEAVGNKALIDHLCTGLNATMTSGPERKPCGRYAATLQIDGYYKPIDLSIMPRHTDLLAQLQQAVEALLSSKDFIVKNKRGNEYLWMEDVIDAVLATHKENG